MKNLFIGTLICFILSFLLTSCGGGDDTGVDDWLGTYKGELTSTQTNLRDGSITTEITERTFEIFEGDEDNTIIITREGRDPDIHAVNGDQASTDPYKDRLDERGWEYISGDMTLDSDKLTIEYNYNTRINDGGPEFHVDLFGEYIRQ